jgi:glycosyltransferase involved in cell wall biosynthesis
MSALQPGGGIRTFFRYVYAHSAFEDCEFTLIAPDYGLETYLSSFLPVGRIRLVPSVSSKIDFIKQVRQLAKSDSFDLVHSHGFSAGLLTEFALTGIRTPHLMTGHDMFTAPLFAGLKGCLKRLVAGTLLRRMTAIHTVTEDAKKNILEFFPNLPENRVHPILHGIDAELFRSGETYDIRKEIGMTPDTPLIGFFGRFMGPKGFKILVDAMDHVKRHSTTPITPHVVTFGWGGFIREDYAYLVGLGLRDYFHQMPQTDNMPGALKSVDLVAMPSRWEACGLLAMEALAAGVPIVGSDCIGLREVLEGSPAQQVPAGDPIALANALVKEIQNMEQRRGQFQRYQPEAVDRFAIGRPARALADLYAKLTARAN